MRVAQRVGPPAATLNGHGAPLGDPPGAQSGEARVAHIHREGGWRPIAHLYMHTYLHTTPGRLPRSINPSQPSRACTRGRARAYCGTAHSAQQDSEGAENRARAMGARANEHASQVYTYSIAMFSIACKGIILRGYYVSYVHPYTHLHT